MVDVLVCVIMVQKKPVLIIIKTLKMKEKLKSTNGNPSFNRDTILWSYLSLGALKSGFNPVKLTRSIKKVMA